MLKDTSKPTRTSEFNYHLPHELIAQEPLPDRSQSRMMVLRRADETFEHCRVSDIPRYLTPGDLLVINDTRVIPARIFGHRTDTGGKVELLVLEETAPGVCSAIYRASGRPRVGMPLLLAQHKVKAKIVGLEQGARVSVQFLGDRSVIDVLEENGFAPVPPYIKREGKPSALTRLDRERYQTVYAKHPGAVAAPTAGLHFTTELLKEIEKGGANLAAVTLHVGPGTFKPVKTEFVKDHVMVSERYTISSEAAEAVNAARRTGHRIIAVGSTVVRSLETVASEFEVVTACSGRTSLFIHPPWEFRIVNGLLTNFHLPMSSLIVMISAFAGKDFVFRAYDEAVKQRYRFYSYGDCMLIL